MMTYSAFTRHDAYVDAILLAVRTRLEATLAAERSNDPASLIQCDIDELELRRSARASVAAGVSIPFTWLRERLDLSSTEELAVWILLAHELDPASRQLIRELNTEKVSDTTLDTLRRCVFPGTQRSRSNVELSARGALHRYRIIERTDHDLRSPEHRQTLSVSERVLALALGSRELDPAVIAFASISHDGPSREDLVIDEHAIRTLDHLMTNPSGMTLVVGKSGTGRRSLIGAVGREHGVEFLQVDARRIDTDRAVARMQLRDCTREARLLAKRLLVCNVDALAAITDKPERLDLLEEECSGVLFATADRTLARRWRRAPTVIELERLAGPQLTTLWSRAIPEASAGDAELLATMYPLAPALIAAAGASARRQALGQELTDAHIAAGVTAVLDDRLAGLATRLRVSQVSSDLVLPDDQATALAELVARIRRRTTVMERWGFAEKVGKGVGVAALFSGPPGTGKTMAAQLIAKTLGVAIYQVDLSKIVSKWIGETERNLAQLFDAAEAGHAILLFDEADALFGKRTDVRTSNDRHANQETNYLLQRLESFTGICILTTNHDTAIDQAFLRRLSVHVRFEIPELEERRLLWRAMLPKNAPVAANLELDALARTFVMSGGYIKNAVVRAAFLAADTTGVIDGGLLARAAHLEYEAMGKIAISEQ